MLQRPQVQIRSSIKALEETVLPAINPDHSLATEQIHMVIGLLSMLEQRINLQYSFDCSELARLIEFAGELSEFSSASKSGEDLLSEISSAEKVLKRARAVDPQEVLAAVRQLRHITSENIRVLFRHLDTSQRKAMMSVVLSMSAGQLLADRSWVKPQGWESDPGNVPDIEGLLADSENGWKTEGKSD